MDNLELTTWSRDAVSDSGSQIRTRAPHFYDHWP